jgi:putative phosphoribosyl transferase
MSQSVPTARTSRPIRIGAASRLLQGDLAIPGHRVGLVIMPYASASSRFIPRHRSVADALDHRDLATLLVDLLTEDEETQDERTGRLRFDVGLLAERTAAVEGWKQVLPELQSLRAGLFAGGTCGGGALLAAAQHPRAFHAAVLVSGRPDLAGSALTRLMAPTLLIVSERDTANRAVNERAMTHIHSEVRLELLPAARDLFEEAAALEQITVLAADWFRTHLS